jgi:hypothetical protein
MWVSGLDLIGYGQGLSVDFYEHGNKASVSNTREEFLDQLSN